MQKIKNYLLGDDSKKFLKYAVVGVIVTAIDFVLLYIFVEFFYFWYILAATFSFLVALAISFFLNKFWTFKEMEKIALVQVMKFVALNLLSMGINLVFLYVLVEFFSFWYIFAKVVSVFVAVMVNFFGMRNWVFRTS